jgi:hypothetical protein
MRQGVNPTSVPLSGFLNLSAVSRRVQASRPYFVPQPFLGFLLQSIPLAKKCLPLSRPLAPLRLSTDAQERDTQRLIATNFTDSRACTQLPGSLDDYELPFHAPEERFHEPKLAFTPAKTRFPVPLGSE